MFLSLSLLMIFWSHDHGMIHHHSASFPGELQLYFFNSQLYNNWTEASDQPNGLAAIAVLVQVAPTVLHFRSASSTTASSSSSSSSSSSHDANSQLKHLFHAVDTIKYKGKSHTFSSWSWHPDPVRFFHLRTLDVKWNPSCQAFTRWS